MLARYGFRPTSVAARQQSRGCLYAVLLLFFWLVIPLSSLLVLVIAYPSGSYLIVTYQQMDPRRRPFKSPTRI